MNNNAVTNQSVNNGMGAAASASETEGKKRGKGNKRLNLSLDDKTIVKLDRIKEVHGDASYTQAIKRAIALLEFIDQKKEDGLELFVGDEEKGKLMQLIVGP